ncbi:hypothetical protein M406DRAFT_72782 [Cryphonectria parasitica EP155]|uniref:Protein kinase domain-containing protein n=1 Tax=Cryphonectria parasitica (strain ATCC 38755 / EP155) TaxID=660469 RepID=A0A9P4XYC8_CRYP1|nr:uncharacterized protein M406DRAFT_72782 [Cryphonectria parasitica EP155]KAF3762795.1 hypothetical protein M406DRAFT_72782 [Cryphonectria parasitica EP155]
MADHDNLPDIEPWRVILEQQYLQAKFWLYRRGEPAHMNPFDWFVQVAGVQGIKFCKTLGWGGQGVATLWQMRDRRRRRNVVVKINLDPQMQGAISEEKDMMKDLARAPHIIQRFLLQDISATEARVNIDDDPNLIIMPYCKYGDLTKWLSKSGNGGPRGYPAWIPPSVLWRYFDCLVKGCIAMQYPPRYQELNQGPDDDYVPIPQRPNQDLLPEVVPPPDLRDDDVALVHRDFDHGNGKQTHTVGILLQIMCVADLGLMRPQEYFLREPRYSPHPNWDRELLWSSRAMGKPGWWAPEVWTAEWDDIGPNSDPNTEPRFRTVAGNYGSHSNVWQMGMIMRCCMLLEQPPVAPVTDRVQRFEEPGSPEMHFTGGFDLLNDPACVSFYGREMCELVARCLEYVPHHRPDLETLQRAVTAGLQAADPVGPSWRTTYFGNPPPPRGPVEGVRLADLDPWAGM